MQPICACFTVTDFHKLFSPFWLPKGKMVSGFAICHAGQRRVPLLVRYKVLFSCLKAPTICPYPEPDQSNQHFKSHFFCFYFNITLTSTPEETNKKDTPCN